MKIVGTDKIYGGASNQFCWVNYAIKYFQIQCEALYQTYFDICKDKYTRGFLQELKKKKQSSCSICYLK